MKAAVLTLVALCAFSVSRAADWPPHLRTGRLLNIGLNYSSQAPERLDAFQAMRCRLMLGGASWVAGWGAPGPTALAGYHARGLQALAYCTPHTIYGDNYFDRPERSPEWLAVGADGRPLRPWGTKNQRYAACVNQPGWREHQRAVIKRLVEIKAAGVFWDDAFPFGCHCPVCRKAFRKFLAERHTPAQIKALGVTAQTLPPPPAVRLLDFRDCKTPLDREWAVFAEWSLEDFMRDMKRTARALNPDFIFSVNSSQPGVTSCMLLSQAVMDLWVYEEGPHTLAPQHNNALRYLQGFARARRKPVEMIACGDGWGQEQATPQQYASSLAEGVACGGEMLVHLGHAGKDDEVWRTNPENARTIAAYRKFFDDRQPLLVGLKPAARIALFDSNKSAQFDRKYFLRLRALAEQLNYLGVPYTVLNAETSANLVEHFDVVIASWTQVLSDAELQSLLDFVRAGKLLLAVGLVGTVNERWEPRTHLPEDIKVAEKLSFMQLAAAAALAAANGPELRAPGDARVQLHAWEKVEPDGRVLVLHLMNYTLDAAKQAVAPVQGLALILPNKPHKVHGARWETPEGAAQDLAIQTVGPRISLQLPELGTYALVTVRYASQ